MGKREPRQMLIAERKLCGHPNRGPSGVSDQSFARTKSPIVPPPTNQSVEDSLCECSLCDTTTPPVPMIDLTPVELSANRFPLEPEYGGHRVFDAMNGGECGFAQHLDDRPPDNLT